MSKNYASGGSEEEKNIFNFNEINSKNSRLEIFTYPLIVYYKLCLKN